MEDVLAEAKRLADAGVKECIVIAQDITRYGIDLYGERRLAALLRELCRLDFRWIRLHYLYPDEFTDELIDTIAAEDKDYASSNMLVWFVDEQVEEEESAREMITACEAVEGNKFGPPKGGRIFWLVGLFDYLRNRK